MGFRIIAGLNNDYAHEWQHDPKLGEKIWDAASRWTPRSDHRDFEFRYGQVIEQVHADTQSLIITEHYGGQVITGTHWWRNQTPQERNLELLKSFAEKLGYRVSKRPAS